jgi:predicted transcriptional regulator
MPSASSSLTVHLPDEIKHHVEALAERTGRSTDHLVVEALERYLIEEDQLVEEISAGIAELDAGRGVPQEEVLDGARQITRRACRPTAP